MGADSIMSLFKGASVRTLVVKFIITVLMLFEVLRGNIFAEVSMLTGPGSSQAEAPVLNTNAVFPLHLPAWLNSA